MDQNEQLQNFEEWKVTYIQKIESKKRKTSIDKLILELYTSNDLTPLKKRSLESILNNEYKKYLFEYEIKNKLAKLNEKSVNQLKKLQQEKRKTNPRKQREHQLIKLGAIVNMVGFPKDIGLLTGSLVHLLEMMERNHELSANLKKRGDKILFEREQLKIKAREQKVR